MSKVLRLGFFYYKVRIYFFYGFWFRFGVWNQPSLSAIGTLLSTWYGSKRQKMDESWVKMEVLIDTCIVTYSA